ncbi:response regulator [Microvirga antarctica]|uniref:response regulator n=1 Tax=Microvirga antarctica TaxID=2819233 RepID=UPI001B30AFC1
MNTERSLRILIVEDEVLIALELESLLLDAGHDVVSVATSSVEALRQAEQFSPDLALVDIHLTDGPTGVDVARRLAAERGITVVFMTANAKRIPADFAGASGVLSKPYTERGVKEALAYVLAAESGRSPAPPTTTFIPFVAGARADTPSVV